MKAERVFVSGVAVLSCAWLGCGGAAAEQPVDLRDAPPQVVWANGMRPCAKPADDGLCPPVILGNSGWRCPFPRAADAARIDDARATLQVDVSATGSPEGVKIVDDPGHGFGRMAAMCALAQGYVPAHYPDGRTAPASMRIAVHFSRPAPP